MKQILIVDDDIYIGNMLEEMLQKEGYDILRAYSGTEALLVLSTRRPNLILLDLMLPGLNGEEILPKMVGIPVIVVSARCDADSKVELLLGGAVDYVTKPFDNKELLARIIVQLRRKEKVENNAAEAEKHLQFDELLLNIDTHEVFVGSQAVKLTRTEYAILKLLMQNPTQIITKSLILEKISEDTPDCTENSLKMHISNLRRKLRETSEKDYIEAVWGIGFKLKS